MAVSCRTFFKICTLYAVIYISIRIRILHGDDARYLLLHTQKQKKTFLDVNYISFKQRVLYQNKLANRMLYYDLINEKDGVDKGHGKNY